MARFFRSLIAIMFFLMFLINFYHLAENVTAWRSARHAHDRSVEELSKLEAKRDAMAKEIELLKTDHFAKEKAIRKFGYVKFGERTYLVRSKKTKMP